METIFAILGGSSTLGALALVAYLVVKVIGSKDDVITIRKDLDEKDEELRSVRGELQVEELAHTATRDELAKERNLRAAVESERNDAYRRARDYYAARIKSSGVADAIHIVDDLFAVPLPGVVVSAEVPHVPRSEDGDSALEKP